MTLSLSIADRMPAVNVYGAEVDAVNAPFWDEATVSEAPHEIAVALGVH